MLLAVKYHPLVPPSVFVSLDGEDCVFHVFLAHVHVLHGRYFVSIALVLSFSHTLRGRCGMFDLELVVDGLKFLELCYPVAPVCHNFFNFSELAVDDLGWYIPLSAFDGMHD